MTSNKSCDVAMGELDGKNTEYSNFSDMSRTSVAKDGESAFENSLITVPDSSDKAKETVSSVNTSNNEIYKPMAIKKKHRRGSRRRKKYKPYSKLTWEEKKAVEERDSRRAVSIREKYMHEKGRPLAPFNTSQFLMAEHDTQEPDLHVHISKTARFSSSADDSEDGDSSISDEERDIEDVRNFLQKDFAETYDRFHSETLRRMNKEQLINEYMELENKVENLERELASIKENGKINGHIAPGDISNRVNNADAVENTSIDASRRTLEHEIETLREENQTLDDENNFLRPLAITKGFSSV